MFSGSAKFFFYISKVFSIVSKPLFLYFLIDFNESLANNFALVLAALASLLPFAYDHLFKGYIKEVVDSGPKTASELFKYSASWLINIFLLLPIICIFSYIWVGKYGAITVILVVLITLLEKVLEDFSRYYIYLKQFGYLSVVYLGRFLLPYLFAYIFVWYYSILDINTVLAVLFFPLLFVVVFFILSLYLISSSNNIAVIFFYFLFKLKQDEEEEDEQVASTSYLLS